MDARARPSLVAVSVRTSEGTTAMEVDRARALGVVVVASAWRRPRARTATSDARDAHDDDDDDDEEEVTIEDVSGNVLDVKVPIGVVADVASARERGFDVELVIRATRTRTRGKGRENALTWMDAIDRECRHAYFNALKEATYGMYASAAKVMTMSDDALDSLWRAVSEGNRARADVISGELRVGKTTRRVVPTRAYATTNGYFAGATYASAPVSVEDGATIGDALMQFGVDLTRVTRVISQGIEVDLAFDLASTYEALRHVDLFLYLVAHLRE